MKSVTNKKVECCNNNACQRHSCQSFAHDLTSNCPWGTAIQGVQFDSRGI